MLGSDVATNRATLGDVAVIGRCERHHDDLAGNFGEHQPVCWRSRWVKQRIRVPDLVDVVDAVRVVLEQVGCLPVDLERVAVVRLIEIEQVVHCSSVLQMNTNVENLRDSIRWAQPQEQRSGGDFETVTKRTMPANPRNPSDQQRITTRRSASGDVLDILAHSFNRLAFDDGLLGRPDCSARGQSGYRVSPWERRMVKCRGWLASSVAR